MCEAAFRILLGCAAILVGRAAHAVDQFWVPSGAADYYGGAASDGASPNWSGTNGMFVPNAAFDEVALISNGGTAYIDQIPDGSNQLAFPGGLILGRGAAESGALEVRAGGLFEAVTCNTPGVCDGDIIVGGAGVGSLAVAPGGSVVGNSLSVGGQAGSVMTAGAASGGASMVQISGDVEFNRTIEIVGPNVSFSAGGALAFGSSATLVAGITSSVGHSPIQSGGAATLGGALDVQFLPGLSASVGDSWSLIDASSVQGAFSSVSLANAPDVGPGADFRVRQTTGGAGVIVQLEVVPVLSLRVDWNSKTVTLANSSSTPVAIDGYSILSPSGALDSSPESWNSLEESIAGWEETATTPNDMSELRRVGSTSLAGGYTKNLGAIFSPTFAEFMADPEDVTFEYREADGTISKGVVVYEGARVVNNLRLTVDPSDGSAQLKNDSPFTVSIDGYSIVSESGALTPGSWTGLGVSGWDAASPTSEALSELLPVQGEFLTLGPGASFSLGSVFDPNGERDLSLEFRTAAGPLDGVVTYGAIAAGLPGDFNGDQVVDAADYTVWRDGLGTTYTQGDYQVWRSNFGASSGAFTADSAAAPEPTGILIALAAAGCLASRRSVGPL